MRQILSHVSTWTLRNASGVMIMAATYLSEGMNITMTNRIPIMIRDKKGLAGS